MGHVKWLREMLENDMIHEIRWCDTRDMTADGHTKGSIDRKMLIQCMQGYQHFSHEVKTYQPFRKTS